MSDVNPNDASIDFSQNTVLGLDDNRPLIFQGLRHFECEYYTVHAYAESGFYPYPQAVGLDQIFGNNNKLQQLNEVLRMRSVCFK